MIYDRFGRMREIRKKRKRGSEKIRAEEREEKDHTMKEFEKVIPEDRESLICTHRLLMNQKKKLQQTLFSTKS